jgi:antitoxin component of MazEF toxin-antitoxin module
MAKALIGKWGKNLGVRFPSDFTKAAGLKPGQEVEIEMHDSKIVIGLPDAEARVRADAAAKRIIARRRGHSLGNITIRELIGRDSH